MTRERAPDDPVATSFDTFAGCVAAASTALGRELSREDVLVATGRAFGLAVEPRLRRLPPELDVPDAASALRACGLSAEVVAAHGPGVGLALDRLESGLRAGLPALVHGVGGPVFGLAVGLERGRVLARTALAPGVVPIPLASLSARSVFLVLVTALRPSPEPVRAREAVREELAEPRGPVVRGPAAYLAWAAILAGHPVGRLDPPTHAWTLAVVEERRRALGLALAGFPDEPARALARAELACLEELRRLFPVPGGGSFAARDVDAGAELLRAAAVHARGWLERLASAASPGHT